MEKFITQLSLKVYFPQYSYLNQCSGTLFIYFNAALSTEYKQNLDEFVSAFIDFEVVDELQIYLEREIHPFVKRLIAEFAAENIVLGINQAGKTADLLGLFEKQINIGAIYPISLKSCFDTGSLYVAIDVLNHLIANESLYTGLSPFVTVERLTIMRDKVINFLN